jgi:hypothetical protein
MLIPILRINNDFDYVKDFILDSLIEAKQILKFKRRAGWVVIGIDMIRRYNRKSLYGRYVARSGNSRDVRECL